MLKAIQIWLWSKWFTNSFTDSLSFGLVDFPQTHSIMFNYILLYTTSQAICNIYIYLYTCSNHLIMFWMRHNFRTLCVQFSSEQCMWLWNIIIPFIHYFSCIFGIRAALRDINITFFCIKVFKIVLHFCELCSLRTVWRFSWLNTYDPWLVPPTHYPFDSARKWGS